VVAPVPVAAASEITGIVVVFDTMMVEVAVAPGVRMGNEAERRRLTSCGVPGAALRICRLSDR
jgi:hypothetical protein